MKHTTTEYDANLNDDICVCMARYLILIEVLIVRITK